MRTWCFHPDFISVASRRLPAPASQPAGSPLIHLERHKLSPSLLTHTGSCFLPLFSGSFDFCLYQGATAQLSTQALTYRTQYFTPGVQWESRTGRYRQQHGERPLLAGSCGAHKPRPLWRFRSFWQKQVIFLSCSFSAL